MQLLGGLESMAKIVKKKKRRLSLNGISIILFSLSLVAWLISSLIINTVNTSLIMKIQKLNDELVTLKGENQSLHYEIQSLENKDRIYEVAQASMLEQVQENIISVGAGE